jgi:protein TonB
MTRGRQIRALGSALDIRLSREAGAIETSAPEVRIAPAFPEFSNDNVVLFTRSRPSAGAPDRAPAVVADAKERPVPFLGQLDRHHLPLIVAGSLLIHAAIYAALNRHADPLPSTGLAEITVDIVLENEIRAPAIPDQERFVEPLPPEPEPPTASIEQSLPEPPPLAAPSAEPLPLPEPRLEPKPTPPAVPPKREATERRAKAPPSRSASEQRRTGARSEANYHGLVAAHLARQKRYPAEARSRGEQGTASVSFVIDGAGRVTSVRLARATGSSSLDQEARAMVQRASPFPPPPSGRAMSFTVPVTFRFQ